MNEVYSHLEEGSLSSYKQEMYQSFADIFEEIGRHDSLYTQTQKVSDYQEVLFTLFAFSIYNSYPTPKALKKVRKQIYKLHRWV